MGHSTSTMRRETLEKFGRSWFRHTMRLNIVINTETKSGLTIRQGARGSVVVKALCYKPEGRGIASR
jgi:hypothetical protein